MFKMFKKNSNVELFSPVTGTLIAIEDVPDKIFSSKMMGEGVAFNLNDDNVCAPCDGTIMLIAKTLHAFAIVADNGAEILVHIGLDTVELDGEGFTKLAEQGQKVKKGEPIIKVDRQSLQEKKYVLLTPMVVTNTGDYEISIHQGDKVISGKSLVLECEKK